MLENKEESNGWAIPFDINIKRKKKMAIRLMENRNSILDLVD
jgi:hypothetical protein